MKLHLGSLFSGTDPSWLFMSLGGVLLLLVLIVWVLVRKPAVRRRSLFTPNEMEFHRRLQSALSSYEIWPQVPFLALMEPKARQGTPNWRQAFRLLSNRRVDWVIASSGEPVVIIELDDRTHNKKADRKRDALLGSCGYSVIRYEANAKPSVQQIRADVETLRQSR